MKRVPAMRGTIERRLLVNYRVDPAVLGRVRPTPFRPQLVGDVGMAGICLIRLGHLRPVGLPASIGFTTENAAHRVAVEWDGPDGLCHGVYIPRRDTSSVLTRVVGGRLFPGEHFRSSFIVREQGGRYEVAFTSADGSARVAVTARDVAQMPPGPCSLRWPRPPPSSSRDPSATQRTNAPAASTGSSCAATDGTLSQSLSSRRSRASSRTRMRSRRVQPCSTPHS